MRAVVFHGVGDISLDNVPDPKIEQPTDAVVRITTSAIGDRQMLPMQTKQIRYGEVTALSSRNADRIRCAGVGGLGDSCQPGRDLAAS